MERLLLLIICPTLLITGCNSGTTVNNNEAPTCTIPAFNKQMAEQLIISWGNGLQLYSTNAISDVYLGAGYFTMTYYTPDAVLQPTISPVQRVGTQQIYDYFTHFLVTNPIMSIPSPESNVAMDLGCGYGGYAGYYNFLQYSGTPRQKTTNARFTFIYKYVETPFVSSFVVESSSQSRQTITQTNQPGWYVYQQQSSTLPIQ